MWLTALFEAIAKVFGFAEKAIPSDVIRNDNHVIRKPRLEAKERDKILDEAYAYLWLVDNWGINIETYVNYRYDSLDVEDRNELIQILIDKVALRKAKYKKAMPKRYEQIMKNLNSQK